MTRRRAAAVLLAAAGTLAIGLPGTAPATHAGSAADLDVGSAALHVDFDRAAFAGGGEPILEWVRRSAQIVSHYYGRFPNPSVTVRLVTESGEGVRGGKTFANPEAFIRI